MEDMNAWEIMLRGFSLGMSVALFLLPISVLFYLERMFNKREHRRQRMIELHEQAWEKFYQQAAEQTDGAPATPPPPKPLR